MAEWRTSSFCASGGCVEVHLGTNEVLMAQSHDLDQVVLFDPDEWRDFVAGVKAGEFDLPDSAA